MRLLHASVLPDYNLFFPAIEAMTECRQFAVGFANYDTRELGFSDEARRGTS